jgi:DNA-directed RNA polymerase specialized sigma24 family protein
MDSSSAEEFRALLDRVRHNDEDAIAELVRRYEPEIRAMVRTWLRPYEVQLRKVFDSADICQSVLAWFFLKNATQRYDLSCPDNLRRLLQVMVRNRVFYRVRGNKHESRWQPMVDDVGGRVPPPDQVVSDREIVDKIFARFSAEEADMARRRINGASWEDISIALGGTPDGRRMQMARAASRLARELAPSE